MATNPLIAQPAADGKPLEGAGLASDVADVLAAAGGNDGLGTAAAGAGALEALGDLTDPLAALASAGVGWLIEHVAFLREPLDALCGDPEEIKAHARTWRNVANRLTEVADQREAGLTAVRGWAGDAASAYRAAAAEQVRALRDTARSAAELSDAILGNGVLVAVERALIRDLIADFLGVLIVRALAALALAVETAGAAVAGFLVEAVTGAVHLAARLARRVGQLLEKLTEAARRVAELAGRVSAAVDKLGTVSATHRAGQTVDPGRLSWKAGIEATKEANDAINERAGWLGETPPRERFRVL